MRAYLIAVGAEADRCAADALVIDGRGPAPSRRVAGTAATDPPSRGRLLVRVDGIDAPDLDARLAAALALGPDAIVLPAGHGRDVAHLGARLAVHEAEFGLPDGGIGVVALITAAAGLLAAGSFVAASPRLRGLGWDGQALARDLGLLPAVPRRSGSPGQDVPGTDGTAIGWSPLLAQARGMTRLAAAAAGVEAIETAYPGADADGFRGHVAAARRDGFGALFARDGDEVRLIRTTA